MNSNLPLTLGYLNPALNNSAQVHQLQVNRFTKCICTRAFIQCPEEYRAEKKNDAYSAVFQATGSLQNMN